MVKQTSRAGLEAEVVALRRRVRELEGQTRSHQVQSEIELALRERVKELDCLYTISKLREVHFNDPDRFLQGVVGCLPRSWQYSEQASARITYGDQTYVTERFATSVWRMDAEIMEDGQKIGSVEVYYAKVASSVSGDGPWLPEEYALIAAVAEQVGNVVKHMKVEAALQAAHKQIQKEHEALSESNMALRAVLSQLEEEKREIKLAILSNIQKIIMPIVYELELEVTGRQRSYITLLRQNLQDIASPFFHEMARVHLELTPVEIAICTMIRNGLSTKEIAQLRRISTATVRRHRENVRRKLGLTNSKTNLVTFLQRSFSERESQRG